MVFACVAVGHALIGRHLVYLFGSLGYNAANGDFFVLATAFLGLLGLFVLCPIVPAGELVEHLGFHFEVTTWDYTHSFIYIDAIIWGFIGVAIFSRTKWDELGGA